MDSHMLDLSALPDRGASILDLDDGDGPAAIMIVVQHPEQKPRQRAAVGSSMLRIHEHGRVLLDCRRPSIQAHLCRWLAWRITGSAVPCFLVRDGSAWLLTPGGRLDYVAMWVVGKGYNGAKDCPALRDIEDVADASAALVRAHA